MDTQSDGFIERSSTPSKRRSKKADTWAGELTHVIGQQVRYWRKERQLSITELSERTFDLGHHIPASVLTNLEHDRREAITVPEWLILAAALDVPPVLLVAPIGRVKTLKALPGIPLSPWRLRGWILGALAPRYFTFGLAEWNRAIARIRLYDHHRVLMRGFVELQEHLSRVDADQMEVYPGRRWPEEEIAARQRQRSILQGEQDFVMRRLVHARRQMELLGLMPPELPEGLSERVAQFSADEATLVEPGVHRERPSDTMYSLYKDDML